MITGLDFDYGFQNFHGIFVIGDSGNNFQRFHHVIILKVFLFQANPWWS